MTRRYLDSWTTKQFIVDPERFSRHLPRKAAEIAFNEVEIPADAPESVLTGIVNTDAIVDGGAPSYPIDQTPIRGGRTHKWHRGLSGAGDGGITRTGYNREGQRVPFGTDAKADVSAAQQVTHGRDQGAGTYATKVFEPHGDHGQMFGEQRSTVLVTGLGGTPMASDAGSGHEQLRRGLNADPLNDGPSTGAANDRKRPLHGWRDGAEDGSRWRPARYLHTPLQRPYQPTRQLPTDQVHINPARTPQMIVTAPPPSKPSKGGQLFSSLARFVPKSVPVGGMERAPAPWYESAVAAAEPIPPSELPDYSGAYYA